MHQKWDWEKIGSWFALIWLAAVVAGYYVLHKPFSLTIALNLVKLTRHILVAGVIMLISGGLGRRLLSDLPTHPLAALSVQAGLGLGLLSLGILAVSLAGILYPWVLLLTIVVLAIFLRREICAWGRDWLYLGSVFRSSGKLGKTIAVVMLFILCFTLIDSLVPPIRFDALVYHLTLPKIYLINHQFVYTPQLIFWGMPQNGEMLYTMAMSISGSPGALVLGWMAGLIALVGILGLLLERIGEDAAWVGGATLVAGYTLASGLAWGYNDWWVILFSAGFLISMCTWSFSGKNAHLGLSGIFAGLALGCKYTAGILLFCGAVVIFLNCRSNFSRFYKAVFLFGTSALLVFLPWLIKNYWTTSNPFYPLIFPSGDMSSLRLSLYQGGNPWGNWMDVAFLPFRATFLGVEGAPGYNASIGPLLLGLGLAAIFEMRKGEASERKMIALVSAIALTGVIIWMIAGRFSSYGVQTRLYFAVFPALSILTGTGYLGLSRIIQHGVRFGRIAGFLVVMVLSFNALQVGLDTSKRGAFQTALGLSSSGTYLANNLGWFEPAMSAIGDLPDGSRILMLWEPRSFYCLPLCDPDEIIDRWLRDRYTDLGGESKTPSEILESWRMSGYTHLLFHKAGADFIRQNDKKNYNPEDWEALENTLQLLKAVEYFGDAYTLYRLTQ